MILQLTYWSLAAAGEVSLVFGGDVIPHDPVKYAAKVHTQKLSEHSEDDARAFSNNEGWDHVLGPLSQTFRSVDFAVVNLETPITDNPKAETREMLFNAPPVLLKALRAAGVDVATFANNHALDQHREGIVETRRHLRELDLETAGAAEDEARAWQPLVLEKNGLRVGVLAFTRLLNGFRNLKDPSAPHVPIVHYDKEPEVGGISEAQALARVAQLSSTFDALMVVVHWGDEYQPLPRLEDRRFGYALIDAGAAAVIGHHPHVLQPVETVVRKNGSEGVVAFSLGNLVSNQDFQDSDGIKRDGLLLKVVLKKGAGGTVVSKIEPVPVWTDNRLGQGKRRNIQAVVLDEELKAIAERVGWLSQRDDNVSQSEVKSLSKRSTELTARRLRILRYVPFELWPTAEAQSPASPLVQAASKEKK